MRDHTEIEELLALEALGGLEPDDRARLDVLLAEHGADCPECAELRSGFADTAAMLGTGLGPTDVSAGLEDRTVATALAGGPAAIAAAVVLVAVGALGGYLAAPRNAEQSFLSQPGVRVVPFAPSDGTGGAMTLAVGPDGTKGYVLGSGLAEPPAGQTYELWTIQGDTPTSLGCVVPSDGQVVVPVTGAFTTADVAAVTVESSACPSAPTTSPVMIATL
jgi:anti-sigma-K factor RskA